MSVRQVPRPVARAEARDEAPTAAAVAALTVHRPLSAVLAAGRAHGRASAPTGQFLGDAMVGGTFAVEGAKFDEIPLKFNAPAITETVDMTQAIDAMQVSLVPELRKALIKLHESPPETRLALTGIDAYLRVKAPKPTKNNMNPGEDARLYLTEEGGNWTGENRFNALLFLGWSYSHLTNTQADKKKKHFWETIWLRRRETDSLDIIYFDSGTSACWDHPPDEEGDCGEAMEE